jgi:hypothetical protein
MVLAATLLGAGGAVLSWMGGGNVANAILAGAGAFGASMALMIAIKHFLDRTDAAS